MRTPARKPKNDPDIVCPLFADVDPPIYAKNVGKIRLSRFEKSTVIGRGGKVPLTRADYFINGDEDEIFEIIPYHTTEEDLQEQFGAGEYWIDALDTNGRVLPGGRRLMLGGAIKRGGLIVEEDEEETEENTPRTMHPVQPVQVVGAPAIAPEFFQLFQTIMGETQRRSRDDVERERTHAKEENRLHNEYAQTMFQMATTKDQNSGTVAETIAAIRYQLDSEIKKSMASEDSLRKDHRDQMARRDREVEEERKLHREELNEERRRSRDDLARRDREIEDLRRNMSREELDIRNRWQKDNDEIRSRYDRDVSQVRGEMLELRLKLTKENDEIRARSERKIHELEQEIRTLTQKNLELEKDLIKAEVSDEDSSPGFFQQMMPAAQKILTDVVANSMKQAPADPQAQAQARALAEAQARAQAEAQAAFERDQYAQTVSPDRVAFEREQYMQYLQRQAQQPVQVQPTEPIPQDMFAAEPTEDAEASEA